MERNPRTADALVVATTVCLALITWSDLAGPGGGGVLAGAGGVALWKPWLGVLTIMLLALASLTRHRHWTVAIRIALGGWIVAAPFLLNLPEATPARLAYLAAGGSILALSVLGRGWARIRPAATGEALVLLPRPNPPRSRPNLPWNRRQRPRTFAI